MRWNRQMIKVEVAPGQTKEFAFYRAYSARHGEGVSLVVGPTTDGRFQVRSGEHSQSITDIALHGAFHGTHDTAMKAKRAARGWVEGI